MANKNSAKKKHKRNVARPVQKKAVQAVSVSKLPEASVSDVPAAAAPDASTAASKKVPAVSARKKPVASAPEKGMLRSLTGLILHPYSEGEEFIISRNSKASVLAVVLHALCSGLFFLAFFSRVDTAFHNFLVRLSEGAESALAALSEQVYVILNNNVMVWIGKIPVLGEKLQESSKAIIERELPVIVEGIQNWLGSISKDMLSTLHFSPGMPFGLGLLFSIIISVIFILLLVLFLKIIKHRWRGLQSALSLSAVRSTVMIPFVLLSMLLTLVSPILGLLFFTLGLIWSMSHVYTTVLSAADKKSGDRAAWIYPILFLIVFILVSIAAAVVLLTSFAGIAQRLSELALLPK